ncbi:unnamed protein product [Mycena citricolor]|uniref:Peptidase S33 tripeptidyl aminopeptidase-like C-terminal domain-containing protein n=1 Tax=Mycena citricolor TaxID=2018698 RepID=A0AAD2HPU1_9AGAR|nr:unnamed protein product [Mycena citricolor]
MSEPKGSGLGLDPASPSTPRRAWPRQLIVLAALAVAAAFQFLPCKNATQHPQEVGTVHWKPASECNENTDCGSVIVPKDYFNPDAGTASIAIARYRATKSPKRGTVFMNPGGPGGSGLRLASETFADIVGHDWDLLGFDPRGIGQTSPQVACFESAEDYNFFVSNTVLEQGYNVLSSSNRSDPALEASFVEQSREFIALKKTQAELCAKNMGDELRYMGTANVVRDMDLMAQLFDGKGAKMSAGLIRSGSAYLVNMLPHRSGKVVIDGIADPVSWSTEPSHLWAANWVASAEKTYIFYLETCSKAGPEACPLAQYEGELYQDIMDRIEAFLDKLVGTPLPVPFGVRPGYLTSGAARSLLLMYLERPPQYAEAALAFSQAMAGNGTLLFNKLVTKRPDSVPHTDLTRLGVTCMDSPPPASRRDIPTPEDLAKALLLAMEASPHFGASVLVGEPDGGCQYWPVRGPERFAGPWNATLEWPMLIVSNTMDPITPIQSGLRINSLMGNSTRIIVQDGPGHCSTATPSPCTVKLVQNYYAGILPENGTVCDTSFDYFPDSQEVSGLEALGVEDEKLMRSVLDAGKILQDIQRRW